VKILLVEDARAVAALMVARLTSFGYEVNHAENGLIAFESFCASPPDLVLMDIEMPVMNGFEATNRIRAFEALQKWAWTPIIFLTASDTPENLVMAIEAGGDDFLAKDLSEMVLHAKMKAVTRIAAMRQLLSTANMKLEEQANCDGLTGLFNRRWMDMQIDHIWAECVAKHAPFALMMLDVDNFKKYNDNYGHLAGDDCLRNIARSVETAISDSNKAGVTKGAFAARYGGEEFAIVIPGFHSATCKQCATNVIERIRSLGMPHQHNGEWGVVTVSIGGCHREVSSGNVVTVFREADAALFRAKNNGRNRIEFVQ